MLIYHSHEVARTKLDTLMTQYDYTTTDTIKNPMIFLDWEYKFL